MNVKDEATWDAGFLDGGIGSLLPRSHNLTRFKPLSTERKENMKNVKILKLKTTLS